MQLDRIEYMNFPTLRKSNHNAMSIILKHTTYVDSTSLVNTSVAKV